VEFRTPELLIDRSTSSRVYFGTNSLQILHARKCMNPYVKVMTTTFFFHGAKAPIGPGSPHYRGFTITLSYTPHAVELVWTSDQPVAETIIVNSSFNNVFHATNYIGYFPKECYMKYSLIEKEGNIFSCLY
jgi:hypothetical protein